MTWTFILCLCVAVLLLDTCSVAILGTTKQIKRSRFLTLVLFLSISDAIQMVVWIWHLIVLNVGATNSISNMNQCVVLKHLIAGTTIYSLLQVLFICIERLNGTFTVPNRFLKSVSCKVSSIIGIVLTHLYVMLKCGYELFDGPKPCLASNSVQVKTMLFFDIPVLILVLSVVTCYLITIVRLIKHKILTDQQMTEVQIEKKKKASIKMRKGIATLGLIIIVSVISFTPRMIIGIYVNSKLLFDEYESYLRLANYFLLLHPLLDPIVYVFSIKNFRDRLKCCKRQTSSNTVHPNNGVEL